MLMLRPLPPPSPVPPLWRQTFRFRNKRYTALAMTNHTTSIQTPLSRAITKEFNLFQEYGLGKDNVDEGYGTTRKRWRRGRTIVGQCVTLDAVDIWQSQPQAHESYRFVERASACEVQVAEQR